MQKQVPTVVAVGMLSATVGAMSAGMGTWGFLERRYAPYHEHIDGEDVTVYRMWGTFARVYYMESQSEKSWSVSESELSDTGSTDLWYRLEDTNGDGRMDARAYGIGVSRIFHEFDDDGDGHIDRQRVTIPNRLGGGSVRHEDTDLDGQFDNSS